MDFDGCESKYALGPRIATGRTTELFVATVRGNHDFEKTVVIKRLLPHLGHDAAHRAIFAEEAKLGARLLHPKIAQTIELGRSNNALYATIEHVDGLDLLAVLRELAMRDRKLEAPIAAWIVHELLDALDYAHNLTHQGKALGIVHRDVSPGNILLSKRGDIKLIDFGIARQYGPETGGGRTRAPNGRTGYMSPEQVSMSATDARTDVFSAGIVLAELLTGHPLFTAATELDLLMMVRDAKLEHLDKHGVGLDTGLLAIVRKALDRSVAARWHSAAAFRDALGEWMFANRHRVTPQQVADLVAELRDPMAAISRTTTPTALPRSIAIPARKPTPAPVPRAAAPARPSPAAAPRRVGQGSPAQKLAPSSIDDRPPRTSTRGKLHPTRTANYRPAPQPFAPSSRGRLGSTASAPLVRSASAQSEEVTDGTVDTPAADSISKAVSGLIETTPRRG